MRILSHTRSKSVATALGIAILATLSLRSAPPPPPSGIALSTTTAYTQNFDAIGTTATATLPTGFKADKLAGTSPIPVRTVGTYAAAVTATTVVGGANLSSSASNGIYNFGSGTTTTGPDRAIGFLSSGTATQSGNLYAQLANTTGASMTGLQIAYSIEKYRGGSNAAGFSIQLYYSTDGAAWTSAGSSFLTNYTVAEANNPGYSPAPQAGSTVSVNQTLNVTIPDQSNLYLAWNYSVSSGTTTTNAQALAIDDISILGVNGVPTMTNPSGTGASSPASVQAGGGVPTLLTVAVTPGANPTSTGLAVTADLSSIGGLAAQTFYDDGTHGDAAAGNGTFSFSTTVPSNVSAGGKTFAVTITDAQGRTGSASIPLTTTSFSTPPTGTGSATPSSVQAGGSPTLLKVAVSPGANPTSLSYTVTADLSSIGGSATQTLFDDGTNGDAVAGDKVFSFSDSIPANVTPGPKTLPVSIVDDQARANSSSISLTVTPLSTPPSGSGSANPATLQPGATSLLTVRPASGTNPTNTSFTVTADLTSIGGSATQTLTDDGLNGDATANDGLYSFNATVDSATVPGSKTLPVTITDGVSRTASTTIALSVQFPPAPTTVKISQAYGGGGNSGSTYRTDFIELFNQSNGPVDITKWSVQTASATGTVWNSTNLCPAPKNSCILLPGHYFLVQEGSGGASGTTDAPTGDVIGTITTIGAASGKVALVDNTTLLSGACPTGSGIADLVAWGGTANCSEGTPVGTLSNTLAAVRKNNGCIDTDNNVNDFLAIGPIPRNSASPANSCGGDPTQPSGVGTANPSSIGQTGTTLLTVAVTPATSQPSTGITVTGNLTGINGAASQQFYDDGTHGDVAANDNIFSFGTSIPITVAFGQHSVQTTITDAQGRTANAPITLTLQSPTCGVERWSVKVGTDASAGNVDLAHPVKTTIAALRAIPSPPPILTDTPRMAPTEDTVFVINGLMTVYKLEDDVDYHIVMQDPTNPQVTMVTEIPSPACDGATSPFDAAVAAVRAKFDARLTAILGVFQTANLTVQMKGVGFFDLIHGQTGVAPNGIELHPILDMSFTSASTTTLSSNGNPASYGQPVTLTSTVTVGGASPPIATGNVSFLEGASLLGTGTLDGNGKATFTTSILAIGSHTITASYEGDSAAAASISAPVVVTVNQAVPVITWANPADITYGGAISSTQLNATASVPGTFVYTPASGTVLPVGNGQTLSAAFTPTDPFNYAPTSKSVLINVLPASGGGTPASLLATKTLARVNGQIIVTVTLANTGGNTAQNVAVTAAKLGTVSGTPLPQSLGDIAAGATAQAVFTFPGSVGAAGAASSFTVSGTYSTGTFTATSRTTLP